MTVAKNARYPQNERQHVKYGRGLVERDVEVKTFTNRTILVPKMTQVKKINDPHKQKVWWVAFPEELHDESKVTMMDARLMGIIVPAEVVKDTGIGEVK